MSLLSYSRLLTLLDQGILVGSDSSLVNSASIDIRLGNKIKVEVAPYKQPKVSLHSKNPLVMTDFDLEESSYILQPGEFILASSLEIFNLPLWLSAEYKLKSSMARIGLEHLNAGWCDAGWHGSVLTLELKNLTRHHAIELRAGDKIGQVVFYEHEPVPHLKSYAARGRYNGDKEVSGVKNDPQCHANSKEEPYYRCSSCEE